MHYFSQPTPLSSPALPVAMGEPSAPVVRVVSVVSVMTVASWRRDTGPRCCHHPMLGPRVFLATGGLWPREQRNQLRTNKTGDQEEDFLKNCHDIFCKGNIYLKEPNLNICFSRRSWSWHGAQDLKRFKVNSKYLKFVPPGHWHELIYDANSRDSDWHTGASTWTFTTHQFKYFRINDIFDKEDMWNTSIYGN